MESVWDTKFISHSQVLNGRQGQCVPCYLWTCTYTKASPSSPIPLALAICKCTHMASVSSAGGWITNRDRRLCASISSWSTQTSERHFLYQCGSEAREEEKPSTVKACLTVKDPVNTKTGKFSAIGPLKSLLPCLAAGSSNRHTGLGHHHCHPNPVWKRSPK